MACLYPTPRNVKTKDGKTIPIISECGYCVNCRIMKKISNAVKMTGEAIYNKKNSFVTLTYGLTPEKENELIQYQFSKDSLEYLTYREQHSTHPKDNSLNNEHLQKFFKRLRKRGYKFRYFACGEYGDKFDRPHYHFCAFGEDFKMACPNKKEYCSSVSTCKKQCDYRYLYLTWGLGFVSVGSFTSDSAEYVAGYVHKKLYGKEASFYREQKIKPEYAVMSKRPALGTQYFNDIILKHRRTYAEYKGHKVRLPRLWKEKLYSKYPELKETSKYEMLVKQELEILKDPMLYLTRQNKAIQTNMNKLKKLEVLGGSLR